VSHITFEREDQRAFWVHCELALFQSQVHLWEELDSKKADDNSRREFGLAEALNTYSSEYLVRWLANRKNLICADWTKIWHYVAEAAPFEGRLFEIGLQWLYFMQAEGLDLSEAKSVVYVMLQQARYSKGNPADLGSFLSDELSNNLPTVFGLLRPTSLFEALLTFLGSHGEADDVLKIARVYR